jgi:hypothetical protein
VRLHILLLDGDFGVALVLVLQDAGFGSERRNLLQTSGVKDIAWVILLGISLVKGKDGDAFQHQAFRCQ